MDIVMPLVADDLSRYLRLQRPTFERWYADLNRTYIVSPKADVANVEWQTRGLGVTVLDEREVIPELRLMGRTTGRNWQLQQLVKLATVASLADSTDYVLLCDADVVAVAPCCDKDLVVDGRARRGRATVDGDDHSEWVNQAGVVLGVDPVDYVAAVTPSVLSTEAVTLLGEYLERHLMPVGRRMRTAALVPGVGGMARSWRGLLLPRRWTEYQLYDTFLRRSGLYSRFHFGDDPIYGNNVWHPGQFDGWTSDVKGDHFFSVVQGSLEIPVAEVQARLA